MKWKDKQKQQRKKSTWLPNCTRVDTLWYSQPNADSNLPEFHSTFQSEFFLTQLHNLNVHKSKNWSEKEIDKR